jgi:hypothetical protein
MKAEDLLHETYISSLIGQVLAVILIKVKTLVSDNTPACRPLEKGRTKGAGWMRQKPRNLSEVCRLDV